MKLCYLFISVKKARYKRYDILLQYGLSPIAEPRFEYTLSTDGIESIYYAYKVEKLIDGIDVELKYNNEKNVILLFQ